MKIIRLTTFLDFGGVEKRLVNISHLQDKNEWVFCAINKGGEAETRIVQQNKKAVCLNLPFRIPSFGTIYTLYTFFKKEKPYVVHTSGAEANFHGVLAAKLARIPIVVSEEIGIPSQSTIAKNIFRFIYGLSDFVIGNSKPVIEYLQTENKVTPDKLRLIPNPMVFPRLSDTEKKEESAIFRLVSVSRLEPVKNIESVLESVSRLVSENIKIQYTIVGEGAQRAKLEKLVAQLAIGDYVFFAGFQKNPYPFLQKADLYVLTSFAEGFSNSLTEALYSGTPSLSTRVGAAEEIITDNTNGWLVAPDDNDALTEKLKHIILMSSSERHAIGIRGRQVVLENYSLEHHAEALMKIYAKE